MEFGAIFVPSRIEESGAADYHAHHIVSAREAEVSVRLCCVLLTLFFAAGNVLAQQRSAQGPLVVVKAGRLVEVENGRVLEKQVIVVRGKKIEAVGGDVAIPADAKIIDLSTKTVLPGLIDCHTHLADGEQKNNADPTEQLKRTAAQWCWSRCQTHG